MKNNISLFNTMYSKENLEKYGFEKNSSVIDKKIWLSKNIAEHVMRTDEENQRFELVSGYAVTFDGFVVSNHK